MAKRSKLILFLSLLLCFSMLLTSCDRTDPDASDDDLTTETTVEENPDATLEVKKPDYAAIIKEWNKYITYNEPESEALTESKPLFSYSNSGMNTLEWYGNFVYVKTVSDSTLQSGRTKRTETYKVYNVKNVAKTEICGVTESYMLGSTHTTYSFAFLGENSIVMVRKQAYSTVDNEWKNTYSYYDSNGKLLVKELEAETTPHKTGVHANGDAWVSINDQYYVCRDGEIFFTFEVGEERMLPQFELEYAGYKYAINEDAGTIFVFDATYQMLAQYTVPSGESVKDSVRILANGNLFFQWTVELQDDATDFTFEENDDKCKLEQVIVDVATGAVTKLEMKEFVSAEALAAQQAAGTTVEQKGVRYYITDLISNGTMRDTTIKMVNDEEQFVIGYEIVDGKLADEVSFLIVDSAFNIKAVLPNFFVSQSAEVFFAEAGKLVVAEKVMNKYSTPEQSIYYMASTNYLAGSPYYGVVLFADCSGDSTSYQFIDGGFVYQYEMETQSGGIKTHTNVYNNSLIQLIDLTDVTPTVKANGTILYREKNDQGKMETKLCYIQNGVLNTKTLVPENGYLVRQTDDYYIVAIDNDDDSDYDVYRIYNQFGNQLVAVSYYPSIVSTNDGYVVKPTYTGSVEQYYIMK